MIFFLLGAAGFSVLATSFPRRHGIVTRVVLTGVLSAPMMLAPILVVLPALGLLPAY